MGRDDRSITVHFQGLHQLDQDRSVLAERIVASLGFR